MISNAGPNDIRYMFFCVGCGESHGINGSWNFNMDFDNPTISPSILVTGVVPLTDEEYETVRKGEPFVPVKMVCHSFVRDGKIEYLSDCTHKLAGQTVELPDWDTVWD